MTNQHQENRSAVRSDLSGTQEAVKNTPGPWAIHPDSPFEIMMDDGDVCPLIATVCDNTLDERQAIADARLISAAPDLLAACQDYMENRGDWGARIAEAIAKATGAAS